jgi:hypothetical protein
VTLHDDVERFDDAGPRHGAQETHGRVEGPFGAARLLRINPHTLRARMRKLNDDRRRFRTPPA